MADFPLVQVDWIDITKNITGWVSVEDAIEGAGFMECHSVGYCVHKTPDMIVLTQTHSTTAETVMDPLCIPIKVIRNIKFLTEKRHGKKDKPS